jgi:putative phosphoserine phosphatase/1-acylglycerol-3-phosphate O-acyltransferase
MAACLRDLFDITILANKPVRLEDFRIWYGLDLAGCEVRVIPLPYYEEKNAFHLDPAFITRTMENPFHSVSRASGDYDVFLNNSMNEMVYPLSNISVLVCHFPERRRRSYFYADGDEDVALMRLVGHPRPTNPREALTKEAQSRGWPVQRFTSRGRPPLDAYLRGTLATASAVPVFLGAAAMRALTGDKREAANFLTSTLTEIVLALGKVRLNVSGEENLWAARPAVFIWNHRNIFDAQIVGRLVSRDFAAVAKQELKSVPLFAAASRFMHIAFVDRADTKSAVASLEPATQLLREGISVLVAPEGTRVDGPGVGEFKKGAFRMAMAAGVPIVPIVIRNVEDIGSRTSGTMRPGTVDVAVLPPVRVDDWSKRDLDRRIAEVRQSFVGMLEHWPETPAKRSRKKRQ